MSLVPDTHSDGMPKDVYDDPYKTSSSISLPSYEEIEPKLMLSSAPELAAYRVGSVTLTEPLVTIQYLKAHLSLLGAFKALRTSIEENIDAKLPPLVASLDAPQRWAWFVGLAVDSGGLRAFNRAISQLGFKEELPPLDVMMVWHAYMLSPRWYAEDCERLPIMKSLSGMGDRLLPAVIQMGDPRSYHPPPERLGTWFARTNTPFKPLEAARSMTHRTVKCPKCATELTTPHLNEDGTGYAQQHFSVECTHCQSTLIKKETLALSKFLDDLVSDLEQAGKGLGTYLAGTLYTETEAINTHRAQRIKTTIVQTEAFRPTTAHTRPGEWKRELLARFDYSTAGVPAAAAHRMLHFDGRRIANRICSAYTDDRPFSVDLVGAVIRQGSFIDKMHVLGWTERGFFDVPEDEMVLAHVVARYHAFLDLMACSPPSLLVPTLDIDLAWHSHQLMGSQYASSCFNLIGRFIDHNDKVEENFLAASLDITCQAWEKRFQIPYMHCGCPVPGNTIGQRLNHLSRVLKGKNKASHDLAPPDRHDVHMATHPSEHNSVLVRGRAAGSGISLQRKAREERLKKLRKRDTEKVRQGKMDPEAFHRRNEHDYPFLSPVPLCEPTAACVAVEGQLTCGAGVCAVGAGLCAGGYGEGSGGPGGGNGASPCVGGKSAYVGGFGASVLGFPA